MPNSFGLKKDISAYRTDFRRDMVNDDYLPFMTHCMHNLTLFVFARASFNTALHLTASFEPVSPILAALAHML